ncbi:unnamed protein product [Strongylus vulgaris]|uniref:Peptidase A1 domain-containing protein n=1 Tax=Strongylus vulgaris TaxID=40348 RepID=A0A3P7HY56_STRVU|nr:unnamed protein product [Strongylus vulgaris]
MMRNRDGFKAQSLEICEGSFQQPLDGVLGMAFGELSSRGAPPIFERAWKLGIVDPIFTFYMKRGDGYNAKGDFGGVVTYGGIDRENCGDVIAYEPLVTATYWKFRMNGFSIGNYSAKSSYVVISDTGSSFIGAGHEEADKIAKAFNAKVAFSFSNQSKLFSFAFPSYKNHSVTQYCVRKIFKIAS